MQPTRDLHWHAPHPSPLVPSRPGSSGCGLQKPFAVFNANPDDLVWFHSNGRLINHQFHRGDPGGACWVNPVAHTHQLLAIPAGQFDGPRLNR